ncbi:hypothetical protein RJ55_06356 [Drechmeria coniospora]|nr:hypothetical protein RJ55_06356 [Drechmeria coniospora]
MRTASIAAAISLVSWALCSEQRLLSDARSDSSVRFGASIGSSKGNPPAYRDALLELHKALIDIESISGNENAVGDFLAGYLFDRGYSVDLQAVAPSKGRPDRPERFNILAWHGRGRHSPRVVVSSHIDVVPPHIPYGIEDGPVDESTMIRGRGSVDAKGSVAAMVLALDELLHRDKAIRDEDVMLLFVVGEEVGGEGMRTFSDSLARMDQPPSFGAVIFGEPTENKLACGHKGGLFCEMTAKGVPGHSGYPWLGKSANELMVRALAKILDADLGSSELFGNTTFNIGRFDGGVAGNVIPEHALVKMAARVAVGPEKTGSNLVRSKIEAILNDVDPDAFHLDCTHGYGSVECSCDVAGFDTIVVNYGTDIPNLAGDHRRYLYGPGNILVAHGARENLTVGDLETAVEGYKKLILHALKE